MASVGSGHPFGGAEENLYLHWNDAVAARFFRPDMAGRRVFLYVTDETIAEVTASLGKTRDAIVAVVRDGGPPWVNSSSGLCQRALEALHGWRDRTLPYPPYVGYLA